MKFSEVLEQMDKEGNKYTYSRKEWFSPRKEIFLVYSDDYSFTNPNNIGKTKKHKWIAIQLNNEVFPYVPDSKDVFADDWETNNFSEKTLDTSEEVDSSDMKVAIKNNNSIDPSIFLITEI